MSDCEEDYDELYTAHDMEDCGRFSTRHPTTTEPPCDSLTGNSTKCPVVKKRTSVDTLVFWKEKAMTEEARGCALHTIYMNQSAEMERLRASTQEKLDCVNNEMTRLGHSFAEQKRLAVNEMERTNASWGARLDAQKAGVDKMDVISERVMSVQDKKIHRQHKKINQKDKLIAKQK